MPAVNQDVSLPAGNSRRLVIPIKDAAGADAVLTGAAVNWWMGRSQWSSDTHILIKKSIGSGITVSGSTVTVALTSSDTALPPGAYYHECSVVFADGSVATVSTGTFTLTPTIVR